MSNEKKLEGVSLTINLEGKLDAHSSEALAEKIKAVGPEVRKLVLDMERLEYISSAGLRVILAAQKKMNRQGAMLIRHVNDGVMEVFHITGFADILVIE